MDLLPSPEQQDIISSADGLLEKEAPLRRARELSETEAVVDRELWRRYGELGWFGLGLEESSGGVGFSIAEEALLFREIGRHLAPGPFLATVLGARVALGAGLTALVSEILEGNVVVALAEPHGDPDARIGRELSGHFRLMDAIDAEFLVAVGREGAALLDAAAGSNREPVASLDPTVRFSTAELLTPALGFVDAHHDPIYGRGAVLVAAMLAGISEATRDASVEYAKVRQQFGQPIGVFQAVSHRCATMAVRAEAASSLTLYAALALAGLAPDASFQASAARAVATEAAIANAGDNIQNHGGMGFTDEHDAHLFLKRAHVLDQTLGPVRRHLRQLLDEPPAQ